ncbi:aminotransferase class I/II-fold pyridoxal phosphate-dependent enzyme [Ghiorsea bivora]|uniref:aminotransferase class I/II-fold pyridoxal phosphate-dependent enzyme n=1 Tax=Ghiorsea bivora TaxID=1485545 RepID=UPI00056E7C0A|nr:8-amino-7-oxononanoate synthase [Ghiorsea bivora]
MVDTGNWFDVISETQQRKLLASQRDGLWIEVQGQRLLNFASNDYLGLSTNHQVCAAAKAAIDTHGLGSGASRLVSGDDPLLHEFEREFAAWKGFEACLILGSGMLANMGLLPALADRFTHIFSDKLNHASLVDGARLSGAKVHRYPHLDLNILEAQLQKNTAAKRMIVSDGVFSMDGDAVDVQALLDLAETYDTIVVIDDAHGTGTAGIDGKGLVGQAGLAGHVRLLEVGTLGKALGSYGAYILGTSSMIEGLKQRMRTLIYSTALPVCVLAGAQEALNIIKQGDFIKKLHHNIDFFLQNTQGLHLLPSQTAIQPIMLGSDAQALHAAKVMREAGFFVPAIRPPTVPQGQSRLRITLSAQHQQSDIQRLIEALREL